VQGTLPLTTTTHIPDGLNIEGAGMAGVVSESNREWVGDRQGVDVVVVGLPAGMGK
jgi:hypothetical protein